MTRPIFTQEHLDIILLELTNDCNLKNAMNSQICCGGIDCGCYGATVEDYLRYIMAETSHWNELSN